MAEISYNGLSTVPSDYVCQDGDLALALNVIPENGSLLPLRAPSVLLSFPEGYNVEYIHKTSAFTHYIISGPDSTLWWADASDFSTGDTAGGDYFDVTGSHFLGALAFTAIQAVGNTLVISEEDDTGYFLWKDDSYVALGSHLPELSLSFGLTGEVKREVDDENAENKDVLTGFDVSLKDTGLTGSELFNSDLSDDNQTVVTNAVMAQVNKFVADNATNAGKFIMPFFVRYAYRLYDGSYTMQSAPILMITDTKASPYVLVYGINDSSTTYDGLNCTVAAITHMLDYAVTNIFDLPELKKWSDIVSSVDIFVSAPIYTYDQSGTIKRLQSIDDCMGVSVCRPCTRVEQSWEKTVQGSGVTNRLEAPSGWGDFIKYKDDNYYAMDNHCVTSLQKLYAALYGYTITHCVQLPVKDASFVADDIRACCNFYLLKSVKLEELPADTERYIIEVADDHLPSLQARTTLPDDYDSHDTLIADYMFNYNSRLNMAGIKKYLYKGYCPASMFCYQNAVMESYDDVPSSVTGKMAVYIYIHQDNKEMVVRAGTDSESIQLLPLADGGLYLYIFYPNVNAYKAVVFDEANNVSMEVALSEHDYMNGAFWFGAWANADTVTDAAAPSYDNNQTVSLPNKLYMSEVNNPFYFPLEGIITVGTGTILGICSATKALSQGQFGQFPLYAFTDEGVWALEVSSTGVYSAVQPVTRDVCINAKGITQLDTSVIFPTDRGLMRISGSDTICETDVIFGENHLDVTTLPGYDSLLKLSTLTQAEVKGLKDILSSLVMIYDYVNQRIIVSDKDTNVAYVLSHKSNMWGMQVVSVRNSLNSYPEALAMDTENNLIDFSRPQDTVTNCFFITRPLKLGDGNVYKTISDIMQRGFFWKNHVQGALWGSRDLHRWHLMGSTTGAELRFLGGSPYKYFRLAVLAQLQKTESIYGASVQAMEKLNNKMR